MEESARYVRRKVSPGLFETEYYVILGASSAYIGRDMVNVKEPPARGRQVEGEVLTYVVDEGEGSGEALVELPGEPVAGGARTWAAKAQLVEG